MIARSLTKTLWLAAAVVLLLNICHAETEPTALSPEKLHQLRGLYTQLQQAKTVLRWAEHSRANNEGMFDEIDEARESVRKHEQEELKEARQRYEQWLNAAADPNEAKELFAKLRRVFGNARLFEDMNDPNKASLLKPGMVAMTRQLKNSIAENKKQYGRYFEGLSKIDPNDPNEDRLWQNIKQAYVDVQAWNEQERRIMIQNTETPQWLAEYAGQVQYCKTLSTAYSVAINILTGRTGRKASENIKLIQETLDAAYPQWRKIEHLLKQKQ